MSILNQTLPATQIIICDDASTDGTPEIITSIETQYPDLIESVMHKKNGGISVNFNSGLERAKSRYVTLIAGDDLWRPDKLKAEILSITSDEKARWTYSDSFEIDTDSNYVHSFRREFDGREGDILFEVLCHQMTLRNWLAERSLITAVGSFDSQFEIFEDWDFKIRLAAAAPVKHVPEENVAYRRHGTGASSLDGQVFLSNLLRIHNKHRAVINNLDKNSRSLVLENATSELQYNLDRWLKNKKLGPNFHRYLYYTLKIKLYRLRNKV